MNCASPPAQTSEYYGSCPSGQAATAITTTTLNCATFLTTQTTQFFSYGSCPNGYQFVTAITTTTLNCAAPANANIFFSGSSTCSISTATTYKYAGFSFTFVARIVNTTVGASWELVIPSGLAAGTFTGYQFAYGRGSAPSCGTTGIAGNISNIIYYAPFSITAATAYANPFEMFTIPTTVGQTYWIDLLVYDQTVATWGYWYPQFSIIY